MFTLIELIYAVFILVITTCIINIVLRINARFIYGLITWLFIISLFVLWFLYHLNF